MLISLQTGQNKHTFFYMDQNKEHKNAIYIHKKRKNK